MSALVLAAPSLVPTAAVLRPRFGHFPIVLLILCLLWIALMRAALPGFGRRATLWSVAATAALLLSWLPRIAARTWGHGLLTPTYYYLVILPSTIIQVLVLLSLATAPLWMTLGLLAKRRQRRAAESAPAAAESAPTATEPAPTAAEPAPTSAPAPATTAEAVSPAPAEPGLAAPLLVLPRKTAPSRRQVLGALAWAGPGTALALSTYGVAIGAQRLTVRRLRLTIPGLPPTLRGLRLGQITDVHVSRDLTPIRQLEQGCQLLAGEALDLFLATGDMCDNPSQLRDVLGLLGQVPARLGRFACLGNHELYLGLPFVRRSYDRSLVRLLEDDATEVAGLTLAGLSYPHTGTPRLDHARVPRLLDAALRDASTARPTVLLSHHPHVVRHLAGRGVDLMLAGHTHGGQVGLGETSVLEPAYGYVRGLFRGPQNPDGSAAQLFVSSGLGHWLPWRLNCPPEVVVIELA